MKSLVCILALLTWPLAASPQDDTIALEEMAQSAETWAQENLDPELLAALDGADRERTERLLQELQKELDAGYVVDLAALREGIKAILPLLEQHEETLPYALWLKAQMDYLDVAEQFRTAKPRVKPATPSANPLPGEQREIWVTKLAKRSWPAAAQSQVPVLKQAFLAQGVPPELIWIAEVESSFDARARSPKGAAGLFQLMPVTAKRFGLRTWPFDQRLKPEPSANAAAQYLRSLHSQFKDWRLALAAYNAGEGTVSRLLKKHNARTFDAVATSLPAETQMFVPRVEATLLRREGKKIGQLRSPRAETGGGVANPY